MADIIQIRRDTAANWAAVDPVLAQGEFAWAFDTNILKLGDGTNVYSALPIFSGAISFLDTGSAIVTSATVNFVGAGVTVTDVSGVATVTIPGAPAAPVDSVFGRTGAVVAVAGDYNAAQITFDDSGVPVTAPNAQSAIQQLYDRIGVFEAFNTDTTTNLNTTGLTQVPIFGTVTQAGPAGYFTVAGNVLTINLAMRVKVSANVSYESTVNRTNAAIGASYNGAIQGATGRSGYIRNAAGHNEASVHMSTVIDCAASDTVGLFSQRQAAAGAVTMIAARSNYIVEILELL